MNRPLWTYDAFDEKTKQKLKSHGFWTKADIEKNIQAATKICGNIESVIFQETRKCLWQSGHEILQQERCKVCITTMSKYLDELLNGGFELGKLTEIYGNSGSGKTQLCLQLAINVTLPNILGGLEGECVYLETCKSVFPCRLGEMIDAFVEHVKLNLEFKMKVTNQKRAFACPEHDMENKDVKHEKGLVMNRETKNQSQADGNVGEAGTTNFKALKRKRSTGECSSNPNENNGRFEDIPQTESANTTISITNGTSCASAVSLNKTLNGLAVKNNTSKEFKVNMSKSDLKKFMNQSKQPNSNLNQFLHSKIPITKPSEVCQESVLSKIHVHYCANFYELIALVMNIESYVKRKSGKVKLIVIDNITFLFHNEENANYLKRTKNIYFLLNRLDDLARTHNLAVVLVNQLTTKYSDTNNRKVVPSLGETFAHRMQVRLLLQRLQGQDVGDNERELFMCFIDKMGVQNKKHVLFQINAQGVRDV